MKFLMRKLWKSKRGNVLAIAAACFPLFIGAAGLASDTIQWTLWKRQLQRAADSAAIAGVYDRYNNNGGTTTTAAAVAHDLTLNNHAYYSLMTGYSSCGGTCDLSFPADIGVMTDRVEVKISIQQRLAFSSLFLSTAPTITATASAAAIPAGGDACVEALDTSAKNAIYFSGNAGVYMPDCDVFSNSANTNAAAAKGSSSVTANTVGGVGGVASSNNFTVTAYRPYSPKLADPFKNVAPSPSDMNCTNTALTDASTAASVGSYNCFNSLSVGSGKTLNLDNVITGTPRIVYVNAVNGDGNVDIQGNFTCTECTIVLTNSSSSSTADIGKVKVNASSNINMTAPTSGTFKGIAFYQDRRASDSSPGNKINGNSSSVIIGALYFPNQLLEYNGSGNTTAQCTMFVAKRIDFTGNSTTTNKFKSLADCSAEGLPSNATTKMVRLVG